MARWWSYLWGCITFGSSANSIPLGSVLEKAGGDEFKDEVKKLSESHGPLELGTGTSGHPAVVIQSFLLPFRNTALHGIRFSKRTHILKWNLFGTGNVRPVCRI